MAVQWNKVTWYSKLLAVVLFVAVFYIGFNLGQQKKEITSVKAPEEQSPAKTISPAVTIASENINEENFSGKMPVLSGTSATVAPAKKYIDQTIADFRKEANTDVPDLRAKFGASAPPAQYEIDINAKYVKGAKTESIVLTVYTYTGGAHGSSIYN